MIPLLQKAFPASLVFLLALSILGTPAAPPPHPPTWRRKRCLPG